jgi:hypothetical protein
MPIQKFGSDNAPERRAMHGEHPSPKRRMSAGTIRADDKPIPISLVVHQAFCPRRAWLEVMGETTDTVQVATGTVEHGGTDDTATSRATRLRGVDVRSDRLGITGRCDTLEVGP